MKFLVDQNLSPRLAQLLSAAGHPAVHTSELGLDRADDEIVIGRARDDELVVVTADSDFGTILAATHAERPSVVYIRRTHGRRVEDIVALLLGNLVHLIDALEAGSVVVLGEGTARIRSLPIL